MKLTNIGNLDHSSCILIKLNNVHVLLDCAVDSASLTPFLPMAAIPLTRLEELENAPNPPCPELVGVMKQTPGGTVLLNAPLQLAPPTKLDVSLIDAILISNNKQMCALPYVMSDPEFHGRVYATEPCLMMGKLILLALARYMEQCPTIRAEVDLSKVPHYIHPLFKSNRAMQPVYSKETVEKCFARITPVRYNEHIDLFGLVECIPVAAGYSIGSANWVIKAGDYKLSYLSSSSKLTNHTLPIEVALLANPNVLIVSNLSTTPMYTPDTMLQEVCSVVTASVKKGGNVLIPCHSTGVLLDLIEFLVNHLDKVELSTVPIIFVSPVADAALAHPDIYGEWLNASKQAKLYIPELPFAHSQLIKNKRVHHFSNVSDGMGEVYKTPCIVFAGHPSLRCGDAVLLIEKWRDNPQNAVILIEAEYPFVQTLAPFNPMAMRSCYCPIDPRINFTQASKLIKDIRPEMVVISPTYTKPPYTHPHRTDLTLVLDQPFKEIGVGERANFPQPASEIKVKLSPQIVQDLNLQPLKGGEAVSHVTGVLSARDNIPVLNADGSDNVNVLYGDIHLDQLLSVLSTKGLTVSNVKSTNCNHIITLSDETSTVTLTPGMTSVMSLTCQMRITLQKAIQSLLISV